MSKFRVVGNHPVDGVEPGKTVEIDDEARARQLERGGHIEPARQRARKDEEE